MTPKYRPTNSHAMPLRLGLMAALSLASACKSKPPTGGLAPHEVARADVGTAPDTGASPDAGASPHKPVYEDVSSVIEKELDTAAKLNPEMAVKMRGSVRPVLTCVEKLSAADWRAHFGYENPSATELTIPVGFYNRIWPPPIKQGQPTSFQRGKRQDVVQVKFNGASSAVWILGAGFQEAKSTSKPCPGADTTNSKKK